MDYSMNIAPLTVTQPLVLELIDPTGAATPIEAELQYDPRAPYADPTVFMQGASKWRWKFGGASLRDALSGRCGEGNLHVWPCLNSQGNAVVIIELWSPDGKARVQA